MVLILTAFTGPLRSVLQRPTLRSYSVLSPSSVTICTTLPAVTQAKVSAYIGTSLFLSININTKCLLTSLNSSSSLCGPSLWHLQLTVLYTWIPRPHCRLQSRKSVISPIKSSENYLVSPLIMGTQFRMLSDEQIWHYIDILFCNVVIGL